VAATGETINIPDAYSDSRFDASHDGATGYKTRSILCAPVKDGNGSVVGVIQAINSARGAFSPVDSEMITILAAQVQRCFS
jgi:GAF domain-containing protein